MTDLLYSRERILRERLNTFLVRKFGLPEKDYYGNMDAETLLSLKSVLSDINNIFTLKVSLAFIDWVGSKLELDEESKLGIMRSVLSTKPNANGFDILVRTPISLIAEVKCNVPINRGTVYGSAQRSGIEKDVVSLLQGKSKSRIDLADCLKSLVFLDRPGDTECKCPFSDNQQDLSR